MADRGKGLGRSTSSRMQIGGAARHQMCSAASTDEAENLALSDTFRRLAVPIAAVLDQINLGIETLSLALAAAQRKVTPGMTYLRKSQRIPYVVGACLGKATPGDQRVSKSCREHAKTSGHCGPLSANIGQCVGRSGLACGFSANIGPHSVLFGADSGNTWPKAAHIGQTAQLGNLDATSELAVRQG